MSQRVSKVGTNLDHCHLASNEGFNTLIQLSPEEAEYKNNLPVLCVHIVYLHLPRVALHIIETKVKREEKSKPKNQYKQ